MSDGDDGSSRFDTVDLLQLTREEGQRTIDRQIETFNDIDDKAARLLRMNLLLLSIALTGFSVVAANGDAGAIGGVSDLANAFVFGGFLAILTSTILAALIYTGSQYRSGMSGRDLEKRLLDDEAEPIDALYTTAEGYAEWTQHNFEVNTRLAPLSTAMLLALIYGLVLLTAGVAHAFLRVMGPVGIGLLGVVLVLLTWRSGIHSQLNRYWRYRSIELGKD